MTASTTKQNLSTNGSSCDSIAFKAHAKISSLADQSTKRMADLIRDYPELNNKLEERLHQIELELQSTVNAHYENMKIEVTKHKERLAAKERKLENETNSPIYVLPNEILQNCMSFVGGGDYAFVAPVASRFHLCYTEMFSSCETRDVCSASRSLACAKICFEEAPRSFQENIFKAAVIQTKRGDIVEHAITNEIISDNYLYCLEDNDDDDLIMKRRLSNSDTCKILRALGKCLRLLKLMRQKNFRVEWYVCCDGAIEAGKLDIIQWMHSEKLNIELNRGELCHTAAYRSRLDLLKWATEQGYPWSQFIFDAAANGGSIPILEYCLEHSSQKGVILFEEACANAAWSGHLETLQWMHEHSFPWDEETCKMAVRAGNIEILKWVRLNGCPWDVGTFFEALRLQMRNHPNAMEIINYLEENNCPRT